MNIINEVSNSYKRTSHEACGSAKLEIHAGVSGGYMMNGNTVVIDATKNRIITIFSNAKGTANKMNAGFINPFKQ